MVHIALYVCVECLCSVFSIDFAVVSCVSVMGGDESVWCVCGRMWWGMNLFSFLRYCLQFELLWFFVVFKLTRLVLCTVRRTPYIIAFVWSTSTLPLIINRWNYFCFLLNFTIVVDLGLVITNFRKSLPT